jgi:hypothetical protein
MSSAYEQRILRLEAIIQPFKDAIRQLRDQVAQLKQQQFGLGGGGGGGGGGGSGAFYADHLSIVANGSATGITVKRSWDTANDTTSGKVWNRGPDATINTRRQYMVKNPDNTYTIIGQSCSNS